MSAEEFSPPPKMHVDEVEIDLALVRRLVSAQFPAWAELPIQPVLPFGTDNAVFRLGTDMVLRLPRTPRTSVTLAKERRWLPRIAPHLPAAVPVPLAAGAPAEGYPFAWSVYRWIEGKTLAGGAGTNDRAFAMDLARFIAALQAIDPSGGPPPGEHNFFRGEPLAMRDAATRAALAALRNEVDEGAVAAIWEEALRASAWSQPAVWIHGDLDARNLLVDQGRLGGVIDFGGLGVGDPACDVMVAWKVLSSDGREIFWRELAVDEATWLRGRGWALSQALGALSYYTMETNAMLVREARRWLVEVLAER